MSRADEDQPRPGSPLWLLVYGGILVGGAIGVVWYLRWLFADATDSLGLLSVWAANLLVATAPMLVGALVGGGAMMLLHRRASRRREREGS